MSAPPDGTPRRTVFGEVAESYDAVRPGYPDALVAEVLAYAGPGHRTGLEIGAGTGKATRLFAGRLGTLLCVEPDPRMAAVLRRTTAAHPDVRIEVGDFEHWQRRGRRFGLLYAATCWHWLDPERRWDLVHAALEPGGTLALFWNPLGIVDTGLHRELTEIDRAHGVVDPPHGVVAADYGDRAGMWGGKVDRDWPEAECRADGRFTGLRSVRFRQELRFDTARYLGFLNSVSTYRVLPDDRRERLLAATARVLDAHGGGIDMLHLGDLFLARAR